MILEVQPSFKLIRSNKIIKCFLIKNKKCWQMAVDDLAYSILSLLFFFSAIDFFETLSSWGERFHASNILQIHKSLSLFLCLRKGEERKLMLVFELGYFGCTLGLYAGVVRDNTN